MFQIVSCLNVSFLENFVTGSFVRRLNEKSYSYVPIFFTMLRQESLISYQRYYILWVHALFCTALSKLHNIKKSLKRD